MVMQVGVKTLAVTTLVGMAHLVSGLIALKVPAALGVTPLAGFDHFAHSLGIGSQVSAYILIIVGILAVIASTYTFPYRVFLLIPQQLVLLLQVWSISLAMASGRYPDGYIPVGGGAFILNDQIWPWLLTVSHSAWLAAFIYYGVRDSGGDSSRDS